MVVKIILDDFVELVGWPKWATALLLVAGLLMTPSAFSHDTASAQSQGDDLANQSKWQRQRRKLEHNLGFHLRQQMITLFPVHTEPVSQSRANSAP
jgi:Spy/CpxP family protein refolding chaperone